MRLSTVILPTERWSTNQDKWRIAESLGFHAAYTYDHLSWRSFRDQTWFTMVPVLAAASLVTSSIRLGPLVTTPNFRHPLLLAKDLIALDDLSNGRLTVGVGAGGRGFDASVLGHNPWSDAERHHRFEEFTTALDELLRETEGNLSGAYYPVLDSRQCPGPLQRPRPPIYVSAIGHKSIKFAAAIGDGWISVGGLPNSEFSTHEAVRRQSLALDEALRTTKRSEENFERLFLDGQGDESPLSSYSAFVDWAERYRALKITEFILHFPIEGSDFYCDLELFERIATEGHELLKSWDSPGGLDAEIGYRGH